VSVDGSSFENVCLQTRALLVVPDWLHKYPRPANRAANEPFQGPQLFDQGLSGPLGCQQFFFLSVWQLTVKHRFSFRSTTFFFQESGIHSNPRRSLFLSCQGGLAFFPFRGLLRPFGVFPELGKMAFFVRKAVSDLSSSFFVWVFFCLQPTFCWFFRP